MSKVTIKDIAKICGVGVSTVSRAINDFDGINKDTKERILAAVKEYGYVPNDSARNLKLISSNTIAVLIKGSMNPFFNKMLDIIEDRVQTNGYSFLFHRVTDNQDETSVAINLVNERKLNGVIFLGGVVSEKQHILNEQKFPYVMCSVNYSEDTKKLNYPIVSIDNEKESYRLIDYLCKLGHKKIAILGIPQESIGSLRFSGYKKALMDNDIEFDERLSVELKSDEDNSYSFKSGYNAMKYILENRIDCTAIFGISDAVAIGACRAITDSGLSIPKDFSVVGFDGMEIAEYYNPVITTIKQPVEEMANSAVSALFEQIKSGENIKYIQTVFDCKLIKGNSVFVGDARQRYST